MILLCFVPICIFAETGGGGTEFSVDGDYFENLKVNNSDQILTLEYHGHGGNYETGSGSQIQVYKQPGNGESMTCTFGVPRISSWDCGVSPLGAGGYDLNKRRYNFLVQQVKGDWYQIIVNPRTATKGWISKQQKNDIQLSLTPIGNWINKSPGATFWFVGALSLYAKPDESSTVLTQCTKSSGSGKEMHGLVAVGSVQGDWLEAACQRPDCLTSLDIILPCRDEAERNGDTEVKAIENRYKSLKACSKGWVRWLSKKGKMHLYPASKVINCDTYGIPD